MSTRAAPPPELRRSRRIEPLVLAALVLEDLLFSVLGPLLPGYQRTLGLGDGQVGLLSGSYELGVVLGSAGLVLLARRVGQRSAAAGLLGLGIATALFGLVDDFPALLASRAVAGVMAAVCWSAAVNWLLESVPHNARGRTMGRVMSATHAGTIGGPSIGALAAALGHPAVFGALGAVAALVAVVIDRTSDSRTASAQAPLDGRRGTPSADLGDAPGLAPGAGSAGARRRRSALDPIALSCVFACNLASGALGTFVPLGLAMGGFGAGAIGATATVGAVSGVIWGPPAGWLTDRIGSARTAIGGFLAMAILIVAASAAHSPFLLAALALGCGWAAMFAIVPSYLSAGTRGGTDTLTGLAASQGFTATGGFAGALLAGTLAGHWGWRAGLYTVAGLLLLTATVVGIARGRQPVTPATLASDQEPVPGG